MNEQNYLYLYPHCHIVKGYNRSLLQDTFRGSYFFIPDLLATMLPKMHGATLLDSKMLFTGNSHNYFEEYVIFLQEKEAVNLSEISLDYQKLPLDFQYPAIITNSIFIYDKRNENQQTITELIKNRCEHIQIFVNQKITSKKLKTILSLFEDSLVETIEIVVSFQKPFLNIQYWQKLYDQYRRLQSAVVYNAPKTEKISVDCLNYNWVLFINEPVSYNDCGAIHPLHLTNNLLFFTESQQHNTCLNRKVCIDAGGNIKNCPAMERSFGNIKDTTLQEAIEKEGFKDLWFINKDKIDVCKDCEFRYMCTDCRCFIKDPENIYSQPAKCGYNPYICKWAGQEGYVPVEECGNYSRETGFVPDAAKIKELNQQIWGEENE
ncbi:MAG: grasp-with-spasm system SPASM domain peptide maturase [Bacteroidales bacterium]|jgi:SPASM domain peptide maturase of grasp-with-spasm system|nr:grasp-with-spasm system SPASM domain peptide maturase [Bacteroidales bacterium]